MKSSIKGRGNSHSLSMKAQNENNNNYEELMKKFDDVFKRLYVVEAKYDQLIMVTDSAVFKPFISNIVGELILFCLQLQPKDIRLITDEGPYYDNLSSIAKENVRKLRLKFGDDFLAVGLKLIMTRNASVHFPDAKEQKSKIQTASDIFTLCPELEIEMLIHKKYIDEFDWIEYHIDFKQWYHE